MKKIYTVISLLAITLLAATPAQVNAQCNTPGNLDTNHVSGSSMTILWDSVATAVGYDIVVNNDSTPGNSPGVVVMANNYILQGLQRDKNYCVHIRTRCDSNQLSSWTTSCYTLPCTGYTTGSLNADNVNTNSARINWEAFNWAGGYQYSLVIGDSALPIQGVSTTNNMAMLQGLTPNKEYCFYLRVYCPNSGTYTEWEKFCFTTKQVGTDVDVIANDITFRIFPNPAIHVLNVSAPLITESYQLAITDVTGRTLLQSTIETKSTEIALDHLPPGMYLVKISGKGSNYTHKIAKL